MTFIDHFFLAEHYGTDTLVALWLIWPVVLWLISSILLPRGNNLKQTMLPL